MNLSDPFKQLVDRRLWPIALLLVAALIAVPLVLKKQDAAPAVLPSPIAASDATGVNPDDSVVALADSGRTDKVRSVLGDRKDPFRPAQITTLPKPEVEKSQAPTETAAETPVEESAPAPSGGETVPTVEVPVEPKPTYELFSLVVSFGDATGTQERKVVERLTGLPGGNPAVLYLGLLADHETAAFLVDADVEVEGDGRCNPSPEDCQTLTLKAGETEFFTRGETTYQLDLDKIITRQTFDASEAKASRSGVAKGGLVRLRDMGGRKSPFKYSKKTGVVAKVAVKNSAKPSFRGGAVIDSVG